MPAKIPIGRRTRMEAKEPNVCTLSLPAMMNIANAVTHITTVVPKSGSRRIRIATIPSMAKNVKRFFKKPSCMAFLIVLYLYSLEESHEER